jgi:hypothetical protein
MGQPHVRIVRIFIVSVALFVTAVVSREAVPDAVCEPEPAKHLLVQASIQGMSNWCWAASAEMIMRFISGASPQQCTMVGAKRKRDCCTDDGTSIYGFPGTCDITGWPPFKANGYKFSRTHHQALSFSALKKQIFCKGRPVAFSQREIEDDHPVDRGHMYVAVGYRVTVDGDFVEYIDPRSGTLGIMRYTEYVAIPNQKAHWDDFYDIVRHP